MCASASASDLNVNTQSLSKHGKMSAFGLALAPTMPFSFDLPPKGWMTFRPVWCCASISRESYAMKRPSPTSYALQARIPFSSKAKLWRRLTWGILLYFPTSLVPSTSTTAALHPFKPPWDSRAVFMSSAVMTSCFSFTHLLICAFIGAIFRSHMSFPAWGSEKS